MKKHHYLIILINLLVFLYFFTTSLLRKEDILNEGKLILLDLAPVDPRSLIQGDYMRLDYEIANNKTDETPKRGYIVVELDEENRGKFIRLQEEVLPLDVGEYLIEYNAGKWNLDIGASSYFFEEGTAFYFENAVYGGLKIDDKGNSVLVGLYDSSLQYIDPTNFEIDSVNISD